MPRLQDIQLSIPVYEAQELITVCDDDIAQARAEAARSYRFARTGSEAAFWFGVLEVLAASARPQA
jgi:hypothetical protein